MWVNDDAILIVVLPVTVILLLSVITLVVMSVICWFKIRKKLGSSKETITYIDNIPSFPIYDTPDTDTPIDTKTTTLELKENVAYGEISHWFIMLYVTSLSLY